MSGVQYKGQCLTLGRCKAPSRGEGPAMPGLGLEGAALMSELMSVKAADSETIYEPSTYLNLAKAMQ